MTDAKRVSEIIHTIYQAAAVPAIWPELVMSLLDEFEANRGHLMVLDSSEVSPVLSFINDSTEAETAAFYDHYMHIDPRLQGMYANVHRVTLRVETVPDEVFRRSEIYTDFLYPNKSEHNIALVMDAREGYESFLSFMREDSRGLYSDRQRALFDLLAPHLVQATRIFRSLSAHRLEAGINREALDGVADGVVLLGGDGRLVFANARARRLLARGDGLSVTREGRLDCARFETRRALDRLLDGILRRSEGIEVSAGGSLAVARPSGLRPYSLLVSPFQLPSGPVAGALSGAIVLLRDPEDVPSSPADHLARLHGLTPAEARLAAAFAEVASLPAAADALGITHGTARSTLKNIFTKTDTNNQAALMKYLLTATPG